MVKVEQMKDEGRNGMEGWHAMTDFWTMERVDKLFELVRKGFSFSQIGAAIGCSRNSAIGKYNRTRVSRGIHVRKPRKPVPVLVSGGDTPTKPFARRRPKVATIAGVVLPAIVPPTTSGERVGIVEVTGCRYAIEDDADVIGGKVFCNAMTEEHRSYCAYHSRIVYTVPPKCAKQRKYKTIPTSLLRMGVR
jgi:hypothetical protein